MTMPRHPAVLLDEEITALAEQVAEVVRSEARNIRRATSDRVRRSYAGRPVRNIDDPEHIAENARALRRVIEAEVIPAHLPDEPDAILPTEFDRELMKKALAGLRAEGLRRLAGELSLDVRGASLERLATAVGAAVQWDEAEVARLVLRNEPEPSPDRAYAARVFRLDLDPDVGHALRRLRLIEGRYIRVGIARWWVFDDVQSTEEGLNLTGSLRAYSADVDRKVGAVTPVLRDVQPVQLRVVARERVVRVDGGSQVDAVAAMDALEAATGIERVRGIDGWPVENLDFVSRITLMMLDLIETRLPATGIRGRNPTVARFKVRGSSDLAEDSRRPALKAVRFEGSHIFDNAEACKLVLNSARELVDFSMTVDSPRKDGGSEVRLPIRIAVERDHAYVMTGFGLAPAVALEVHRLVLGAVADALVGGIADPAALRVLIEKIRGRASIEGDVAVADMFADPQPADATFGGDADPSDGSTDDLPFRA